ncbi:unnamed protein product [Moneuplotes crassus]|uniref:Uncharacterized protein n=1 Tax=Euplotes crassus TaxID=5936 RepID=A0AAD1U3U1_EUPCR|nr:unnamed protein product [Moneuplotes crassus]
MDRMTVNKLRAALNLKVKNKSRVKKPFNIKNSPKNTTDSIVLGLHKNSFYRSRDRHCTLQDVCKADRLSQEYSRTQSVGKASSKTNIKLGFAKPEYNSSSRVNNKDTIHKALQSIYREKAGQKRRIKLNKNRSLILGSKIHRSDWEDKSPTKIREMARRESIESEKARTASLYSIRSKSVSKGFDRASNYKSSIFFGKSSKVESKPKNLAHLKEKTLNNLKNDEFSRLKLRKDLKLQGNRNPNVSLHKNQIMTLWMKNSPILQNKSEKL